MNQRCPVSTQNPRDDVIRSLLEQASSIAVVGLSPRPERESHQVASYLIEQGYDVIPVNPTCQRILGLRCYPDILSISAVPDIVNVFRRPEALPGIAREAVAKGAGALWMQLGISNREAAGIASEAGLLVVESRCIKLEHLRLIRTRQV